MEEWMQAVASVVVAVIVSIPGIVALMKQRKKEDAEAEKLKSDTRKTDIEIANVVQDVYQGLLDDLAKQTKESKGEIDKMSAQVKEIASQNEQLIKQNRELRLANELLVLKFDKLNAGVKVLITQLKREGLDPEYEVEGE